MTIEFTILVFVLGIAILAFLFPAYLIDSIRLTDEEKARDARGKACACFGFMMLLPVWLMIGING